LGLVVNLVSLSDPVFVGGFGLVLGLSSIMIVRALVKYRIRNAPRMPLLGPAPRR
jgi:hypothetical protein